MEFVIAEQSLLCFGLINAVGAGITQQIGLRHPTQHRPGKDDGSEHGGNDTDGQRKREAFDSAGTEIVKHDSGNKGGQVGVEDGPESAFEAAFDTGPEGLALPHLLAYSLVNDDVGVDSHTYR